MARKKEKTYGQKIAQKIIEENKPENVEDMKDALKGFFCPIYVTIRRDGTAVKCALCCSLT